MYVRHNMLEQKSVCHTAAIFDNIGLLRCVALRCVALRCVALRCVVMEPQSYIVILLLELKANLTYLGHPVKCGIYSIILYAK